VPLITAHHRVCQDYRVILHIVVRILTNTVIIHTNNNNNNNKNRRLVKVNYWQEYTSTYTSINVERTMRLHTCV
jgi:hypothetical protein